MRCLCRVNRSLKAVVCCAHPGCACAACVCERGQVVFHSAEPGRVHVNRGGIWVLVKKVASAHPGAGRSDVDGHRRQREGQPGCGSRSLGRSSSHVATRHSSTPSALLRPGRRSRTHPSPAAQVPPPPPSSPFPPPCRPTGNDDTGAAARGGA